MVKDKATRESKGVAFVLFVDKASVQVATTALDKRQLFGRTITCSIAKDNGRTTEFIKRRQYKDKSRCYECGESGHLSYMCPKNSLGDRELPEKKKKLRKRDRKGELKREEEEEEEEGEEEFEDDGDDVTLGDTVRFCQEMRRSRSGEKEGEDSILGRGSGRTLGRQVERDNDNGSRHQQVPVATLMHTGSNAGVRDRDGSGSYRHHLDEFGRRKVLKKDSYFSDEDASD